MERVSMTTVCVAAFVSLSIAAVSAQSSPPAAKPSAPKPATTKAAAAKVAWPIAIETAFKKAYPTATVKNVSQEKEDGKDVYEVESVDGGLGRDLIYRPDGTLVEIEEELSATDVPSAVSAAVVARYPKATITKREKLTKGTVVSYEFQLKGAGVAEAVLSPDGAWISPKPKK